MNRAKRDILDERLAQDQRWGGPDHDDVHSPVDWVHFINKQCRVLSIEAEADGANYRYALIRIGALAHAAIEAHDRRHDADTSFQQSKEEHQ